MTQQGVGKPCIRTVPEDFLADEAVRKEFDKLCQSLTLMDGNPGGLNLVAEVLKNECCIKFLFHLYEVCWKFCVTPSEWRRGIIHPIPKSVSKDLRCPMSYRGISLLSVPYKAFCSILNSCLTAWLEVESVIHEAQNGFRKERSCLEHIFVISNLVDTRKRMGLDTFVCFVDF